MEQTLDADATALDAHTDRMKAEEAFFLVELLGWTHEAAGEFLGCDTEKAVERKLPLAFMPLPNEIAAITKAIRSGRVIVNQSSGNRWQQWRDEQASDEPEAITEEAGDDADTESLSPVTMPSWFGSGG